MDQSRREYPSMLATVSPASAVSIISERVKHINRLNLEIADWLQERRRVEEVYQQGLRKLGRRQPSDKSSELGIFTVPWQEIINSAEILAESHCVLAQKIENDVERPLREFASKDSEFQAISTIRGNFASIAREVEAANRKVEKLKDKGGKAAVGKVASATAEVDRANAQWQSQAPFIFERLQTVDESRTNHLRDVLTQLQTHQLDQIEMSRAAAEKCLNSLLNISTSDGISTFANNIIKGQQKYRSRPNKPRSSPSISRRPPTSEKDKLGNMLGTASEIKPGGLSGLKRLSTVLGGRRQTINPYGDSSLSPDGNLSSDLDSSMASLKRKASKQDNGATLSEPLSQLSQIQYQSKDNPLDDSSAKDESSNSHGTPNIIEESKNHTGNDYCARSDFLTTSRNGEGKNHATKLPLHPQHGDSEVFADIPTSDDNCVIAPKTSGIDPITKAQEEAARVSDISIPQLRVDIKKAPIAEEETEADAALANVASTLRAQAATARKPGTVRGRRDVRNTIFVSSPQTAGSFATSDNSASTPTSSSLPINGIKTGHRAFQVDNHAFSDTQSIRSSRSLGCSISTNLRHPDFEKTGLNASIIETVSAWIRDGKITKSALIGEVALAYKPSDTSTSIGSATVRIDNFSILEKVAQNPNFVRQVPDRLGEYVIELQNIAQTSVTFKYQVHLEDENFESQVPLLLVPVWKVESTQASVILSYSLNPTFKLGSSATVILRNLILVVHLEGTKAKSCQSKPVGTFSRERSAVYWRLGDVVLKNGQGAEQLRARFFTEIEGKPGQAEARWDIVTEDATRAGSGLYISHSLHTTTQALPGLEVKADPFSDDIVSSPSSAGWKTVPTVRRLTSGTFIAF